VAAPQAVFYRSRLQPAAAALVIFVKKRSVAMNENRKAHKDKQQGKTVPPDETPVKTQDWDQFGGDEVELDIENEDILAHVEDIEEEEAEEEIDSDDNPYQESDEALPDDEEEAAINRNPSRQGGRFDEI
jgi:hypothetical protein